MWYWGNVYIRVAFYRQYFIFYWKQQYISVTFLFIFLPFHCDIPLVMKDVLRYQMYFYSSNLFLTFHCFLISMYTVPIVSLLSLWYIDCLPYFIIIRHDFDTGNIYCMLGITLQQVLSKPYLIFKINCSSFSAAKANDLSPEFNHIGS